MLTRKKKRKREKKKKRGEEKKNLRRIKIEPANISPAPNANLSPPPCAINLYPFHFHHARRSQIHQFDHP